MMGLEQIPVFSPRKMKVRCFALVAVCCGSSTPNNERGRDGVSLLLGLPRLPTAGWEWNVGRLVGDQQKGEGVPNAFEAGCFGEIAWSFQIFQMP